MVRNVLRLRFTMMNLSLSLHESFSSILVFCSFYIFSKVLNVMSLSHFPMIAGCSTFISCTVWQRANKSPDVEKHLLDMLVKDGLVISFFFLVYISVMLKVKSQVQLSPWFFPLDYIVTLICSEMEAGREKGENFDNLIDIA